MIRAVCFLCVFFGGGGTFTSTFAVYTSRLTINSNINPPHTHTQTRQGPTGPAGAKGATGATGAGATGATGPVGPTGEFFCVTWACVCF
jgi:hypothetical protein